LALVSNVTLQTELVAQGLAEPGDLLLATRPGQVHLDPFDLCFVPWHMGIAASSLVVTRGTGPTDALLYRAATVEGVWTVDPTTGQITAYTVDRDVTVAGRTVTWIGRAPAAGTVYTIRYSGDFEWVVFRPPDQRVAFGVDLGQRAILRKRFLVLPNAPPLSLLEG
jgi:hypothetical protein